MKGTLGRNGLRIIPVQTQQTFICSKLTIETPEQGLCVPIMSRTRFSRLNG